jgi:hypothetical protein
MCVSIFSTTFVSKFFHSKKNWARCDKKCVLIFMQSTFYLSSCKVPSIDLHAKYLLLIFMQSIFYWSSCKVTSIDLHAKYLLLIFMQSTFYWSSCKVPSILVRFWWSFTFLDSLPKSRQIQNFIKNPSPGRRVVLCGQRDGRTDRRDEANSRFQQFYERA